MNNRELKQLSQSLIESLYPVIKDKLFDEMLSYINEQVAMNVSKWMDFPLTVKQVAMLLGVKISTIYKWQERHVLTLDKNGKKQFTITLRSLNIQLSGLKKPALELSDNHKKSSKVKSGDSAGEANSEQ